MPVRPSTTCEVLGGGKKRHHLTLTKPGCLTTPPKGGDPGSSVPLSLTLLVYRSPQGLHNARGDRAGSLMSTGERGVLVRVGI